MPLWLKGLQHGVEWSSPPFRVYDSASESGLASSHSRTPHAVFPNRQRFAALRRRLESSPMAKRYRTLKDMDFKGKRVLIRVDHNIDIDETGKLKNDKKIRATLPTIQYLIDQGARIVMMCHVGRPKGKPNPRYSTAGVATRLGELLPGVSVKHITQTVGPEVETMSKELKPGSILYIENVRFSPDEEGPKKQQEAFGKELAKLGDVYVNEAFPSCHDYEEASTCAVARLLPACMGIQCEQEVMHLSKALDDPRRPVTLIISGAKMETKIPVIERFLNKGDSILLGGAIANTFIAARGFDVGKSLFEAQQIEKAQELMLEADKEDKADILVPRDGVVASEPSETATKLDLPMEDVVGDMCIFDIGKVSIKRYTEVIEKSGTIVWNGPVGMYELNRFSHGTKRIAEAVAAATKKGAVTIVGGGDTLDFHKRYEYPLDAYTFVSTGGGAMLEFVGGKPFASLAALEA